MTSKEQFELMQAVMDVGDAIMNILPDEVPLTLEFAHMHGRCTTAMVKCLTLQRLVLQIKTNQ